MASALAALAVCARKKKGFERGFACSSPTPPLQRVASLWYVFVQLKRTGQVLRERLAAWRVCRASEKRDAGF